MLTRDALLDRLRPVLDRPEVRAAWLGGSDATGRTDRLSDIDLVVIAEDDAVEAVLADLEQAAGPASARVRFPPALAHGHAQVILEPTDAPSWLHLDMVVIARSAPTDTMYLEPERHGDALVLVDRDGILTDPPRLDRTAHRDRMAKRLVEIAERTPIFAPLVEKAIARGHLAEAADRHLRFIVAPLVEVLRMRHAPDRFDFGLRYLDRDLPDADRRFVERLCCWGDLETLRRRFLDATARLGAELESLGAASFGKPQSIVQSDAPTTRS